MAFNIRGLFKSKANQDKVPAQYAHLISQEGYKELMSLVTQTFMAYDATITSNKDGHLFITKSAQPEDLKMEIWLDNIIKTVKDQEPADWPAAVSRVIKTLLTDRKPAMTYLLKDYDYAAQFIKAYVKPGDFGSAHQHTMLTRVDLPKTNTHLVLDFDDTLTYLDANCLVEWEKTVDELYEVGLANVAEENYEIITRDLPTGRQVFMVTSGDYAATYIIELEKNLPEAVGHLGALVMIPAKGTVFVLPVTQVESISYLVGIMQLAAPIFEQDPGPISMHPYWYYQGEFEPFVLEPTGEGTATISVPPRLNELLVGWKDN